MKRKKQMKYVLHFQPRVSKEAKRWFLSLSEAQTQELCAIDYSRLQATSPEYINIRNVAQDWIEEHGGEREWWIQFYTDKITVRKEA